MAEQITWAFSLEVVSGPKLNGRGAFDVGIYDKTSVALAAGKSAVIDVVPAGGDVTFLAITADQYGAGAKRVSYKQEAGDTEVLVLDNPLVLMGAGAAGMFPKKLQKLSFTNGTEKPVEIEILVGRNV